MPKKPIKSIIDHDRLEATLEEAKASQPEPSEVWFSYHLKGPLVQDYLQLKAKVGAVTNGEMIRQMIRLLSLNGQSRTGLSFGEALDEMAKGRKIRRRSWRHSTYYLYIDPRYPGRIQKILDQSEFADEDLLAGDWEVLA